MIKKQILTNNRNGVIEIAVEPAAEYFDLKPGESATLEIVYGADSYPMSFEIDEDTFTIFQEYGIGLKIYINDDLKYYTDYS